MNMMIMYNILIKKKITPNQFYLLYCMKENFSTSLVNVSLELRQLKKNKWIDDKNTLLPKSLLLINEIENYFKVSKTKTSKIILGNNFHDNLTTYRELFPKGTLPSKKPARSSPKNLEVAFRWFFKNFDFSWEVIIKATARYIDEYEASNYNFMQTSQYFIRKQASDKSWNSTLADYCEIIESGEDIIDNNHFSENVV